MDKQRMEILKKAHDYVETCESELADAKSGRLTALGDFTDVFKSLRGQEMTLRAAAKRLKISAAHLSDIELGRRPPNTKLRERMIALF